MRGKFHKAAVLAGAVGLAPLGLQAAPADNSDKSDTLKEIVVTATKHRESIDKVPISISALNQEDMDAKGIRSVDDVARETPGVDFSRSPFGGGTGASISIRGIASTTGASTTGIYIDDIPVQSRSNQANFAGSAFPLVFDLERIEVLRGPQGTLWGAGAEGGAIRFITPEPSLTKYSGYARSEVSATDGGAPSYEAGAAIGGPIVDGKLGFRASAWFRRDGGYIDRLDYETGQDYKNQNNQDSGVGRVAFVWAPSDAVKITPSVYYQNIRVDGTSAIWLGAGQGAGSFENGRVIGEPTRDVYYLPSLKAEVDLGVAELTSITSYFYRSQSNRADDTEFESVIWTGNPYPSLPGQVAPAYTGTAQNNISQELRLQSGDPGSWLHWTAGVYYADNRERDYNNVQDTFLDQLLLNSLGTNVQGLFGIPLTDGKYTFVSSDITHDKQIAGFGQADIRLADPLTLSAGLRVAKTDFSFRRTTGGPVNYSPGGPLTNVYGGSQSETPVTPKFTLNYQMTPNDLIYASAGEGYRVGGANPAVPLNPACKAALTQLGLQTSPLQYQSDTAWSYEAGIKDKSLDGRFKIEASAFHIDWNNIQQYVGLASCGGIGFTGNLGSATSNGFDLQASALLWDGFSLNAAVGYTNATYAKTIAFNGTVVVDKGDSIVSPPSGISPWSLNVSAEYDFTAFNNDVYLRLEDAYKSHNNGRFAVKDDPLSGSNYDPTLAYDPSINLLNFRAGLLLGDANLSLFVNNLLNAHPALGRQHDLPTSPLYYAATLRPLTGGFTATYSF